MARDKIRSFGKYGWQSCRRGTSRREVYLGKLGMSKLVGCFYMIGTIERLAIGLCFCSLTLR